jgi:hypothetical protein
MDLVLQNGKIIFKDAQIGKFKRVYRPSYRPFGSYNYDFSLKYNEKFFGGRAATLDELRFKIDEFFSRSKKRIA